MRDEPIPEGVYFERERNKFWRKDHPGAYTDVTGQHWPKWFSRRMEFPVFGDHLFEEDADGHQG